MFIDKKNNKYYIKINGKITRASKEEYIKFRKELKRKNIKELCLTCSHEDCDKKLHMNLEGSLDVKIATYILNEDEIFHKNGEKTKRHFVLNFDVFDCDNYQRYTTGKQNKKTLKYTKDNQN